MPRSFAPCSGARELPMSGLENIGYGKLVHTVAKKTQLLSHLEIICMLIVGVYVLATFNFI